MIGRDNRRERNQTIAESIDKALGNEKAEIIVAHDRIADIEEVRVSLARALDKIRHDHRILDRSEIAGEHDRLSFNQAAFLDAAQQAGDQLRFQHPAVDGRIVRMVGQQGGRNRRHGDARRLHGEHGGAVADMAMDHLALDGDHAHHRVPAAPGQ